MADNRLHSAGARGGGVVAVVVSLIFLAAWAENKTRAVQRTRTCLCSIKRSIGRATLSRNQPKCSLRNVLRRHSKSVGWHVTFSVTFSWHLINKNWQGSPWFTEIKLLVSTSNLNYIYDMCFNGFQWTVVFQRQLLLMMWDLVREECQCLGRPSVVACYVNCHWGEVGAVTLLAPGRRWSLTYGSASPLESMAFSPCGHKNAHTDTHRHTCVL